MNSTVGVFMTRMAILFLISLPAPKRCSSADELDFNRDVRPLLADRCYACHGPDEQAREAGLRLDRRDSAVGTGNKVGPIVPGKPSLSELVHRIENNDPGEMMPPPSHNKPLTPGEKKVLIGWISQGAKYQPHWSLVPPRREAVPSNDDKDNRHFQGNAIDHFVLAQLEELDLSPSPIAPPETLIRRVTLDLTGFPPTPAEIHAFLNDTREDAYERLVDRLMRTTAYAERRTQDWLDVARYADTRGYADDKTRAIWPWRDWVVRAIDRNMPFDRFTIEQLAGDMLPDATQEQLLATAFHRNAPQARGMTYPVEEYRIKGVVDRVNTTGRVWLGLTMGCVECHDHKFDPITQRDYYSMLAIFNNIEHQGVGHGQGGPTMDYRLPIEKQVPARATELKRLLAELANAQRKLPNPRRIDAAKIIGQWKGPAVVKDPNSYSVTGNLTIMAKVRTNQPVADIVSKYDWRGKQRSYLFGIGGEGDTTSLPGHLFFWVSSQAESFNGVTVYSSRAVNDGRDHHVAVEFVAGKSVRLFIDGIEDKAVIRSGAVPASIAKSDRPLAIGSGYNNSRKPNAFPFKGELSEVWLSDQPLGDALSIGSAGDRVSALLAEIRKLESVRSEQAVVTLVPVMRERPLSKSRETFIHLRGNFLNHGEQVFPAVPAVFGVPQSDQPANRLEFARWLVNGDNPLVARVVVNRFWQSYFGHGLVRTPDDFGAQGTPPTHPRLLDWLATEFVESGWDMKRINRLIVTSATYRQSARVTPVAGKRDPENRLLTRMTRVRLPAEQLRDQALAVSGLLVKKIGGPPVFPIQARGYWQQRVLPGEWKSSTGEDRYRRTLYTYWRRMALHPSLELLNAPAREGCVVRRDVSNIPTQALVLFNDPIFNEAAMAFASRLVREVKAGETKRLELAFRLALSRLPKPDEKEKFLAYLARQRKDLRRDLPATKALTGGKQRAGATDLAVWTLACSIILNLDETITRP